MGMVRPEKISRSKRKEIWEPAPPAEGVTLITWPKSLAPRGINVLPGRGTSCMTRASISWPGLPLEEEREDSRRTGNAVPAGIICWPERSVEIARRARRMSPFMGVNLQVAGCAPNRCPKGGTKFGGYHSRKPARSPAFPVGCPEGSKGRIGGKSPRGIRPDLERIGRVLVERSEN